MDDKDLIYAYTLDLVEKEFKEIVYEDEDIVQIFREWDEFVNDSRYSWKDVLIPCLKDTILRMRQKITTQHQQIYTTTAN